MCSSTCSCRSARNHVAMAPFQVFSFCTPLKGIRLSTRYGQMSGGDFVSFRREPDSVHDRNAIAATNRGETVGHIERSLAAALADPLDDRQIRLEGYGAFLMTCITVRIRVLVGVPYSEGSSRSWRRRVWDCNVSVFAAENCQPAVVYRTLRQVQSLGLTARLKGWVDEIEEACKSCTSSEGTRSSSPTFDPPERPSSTTPDLGPPDAKRRRPDSQQ